VRGRSRGLGALKEYRLGSVTVWGGAFSLSSLPGSNCAGYGMNRIR